MRTGIYGGAFNPPHVGHLVCAQEALVQLELERVLLVPMGVPPHRELEGDPGVEARAELCDAVAAADERLAVSRVELERSGPSYTVDTLRELRAGELRDAYVALILGGDQAGALPEWREPDAVLELVDALAVAERAPDGRERVRAAVEGVSGARDKLVFFDMPRIDISSTLIRSRLLAGRPVRYLVPDPVADLVEKRALYTPAGAAR